MGAYILKRLAQIFPVTLLMTIVIFSMVHLAPGDPVDMILGAQADKLTAETYDEMRAKLGLDRPLYIQYASWLGGAVTGNFGRSFILKDEVLPMVVDRYKNSLLLAAVAFVIATVTGLAFGVFAAIRYNTWADRLLNGVAIMGICLPSYFVGMLLIVIFSVYLRWFPASGMGQYGQTGFWAILPYMVLPAVTMATGSIAVIARMTRASMVEIFGRDFIRTARAKGLPNRKVVWGHAMRNALVSVVTVLGMQAGYLLGAAVLTEVVFAWPGIGSLLMNAVLQRDFPMVQGGVLFVALTYILFNFLVDVVYGLIDPRIRLS